MTEKKSFRLPSVKLIAIAAVAGMVAGAAAVYVKHAASGKSMAEVAGLSDNCKVDKDKIGKLTKFTVGQVAAMNAVSEPHVLPALSFNDADGKPLSLDNFKGKTVLLNMWATWCVPCREEMPALDALERELGSDKFQVVAVNIDTGDDTKPKGFYKDYNIQSLALYHDSTMGVFNTMKKEGLAFGLPATMLIGEDGCLLGAMNGPAVWDSPDAKALIGAAIGS
ncbi:thiol:disulfide interchange protein TlpA [Rhizobium sp. NRK18]|uniref:thiol:disulfide interchange protein TlpA n=1 Tax=Rhizobium sp. NRK18 TaxID=2964667 RepID=UPI0021C4AEC4|nr:TlpA disulfide reductase family protein [Rhizobium sp. NRK18]MCQ2003078.1 TlpA family protein disulfide reductase [Rhizobium sp. NRK18]